MEEALEEMITAIKEINHKVGIILDKLKDLSESKNIEVKSTQPIPHPFLFKDDIIFCFHKDQPEFTNKYNYGIWCRIDFSYGDKLKHYLKGELISEKKDNKFDPFFTWKSERNKLGDLIKGWFIATDKKDKFEHIRKFVQEDLKGEIFYWFVCGVITR